MLLVHGVHYPQRALVVNSVALYMRKVYKNAMKSIRQRRERAGLSQAAFAKRIGVTQQTVSLWENGTRNVKVTQLYRIAKALGCQPGELL